MADKTIFPFGFEEATTDIKDSDYVGGGTDVNVNGSRQRKISFSKIKEWIQGLSLVFSGTVTAEGGIKLNTDRIESQELESATITTGSGYYTIAKTTATGFKSAIADFVCSYGVGSLSAHVEFTGNGAVKDKTNNTLNINGISGVRNASSRPTKFREVKSDTVSGAGAKLQVYLDAPSNLKLLTGMFNATGEDGIAWELVEPVLENTPLCPDGITVGTFIEEKEVSGTQRNLWTGPLSTVGVTTSLNAGESFNDWEDVEIGVNPTSDTSLIRITPLKMSVKKFTVGTTIEFITATGLISVRRLSGNTFDIYQKTSSVGNAVYIVGVKL